jgi:hypothetical protein
MVATKSKSKAPKKAEKKAVTCGDCSTALAILASVVASEGSDDAIRYVMTAGQMAAVRKLLGG